MDKKSYADSINQMLKSFRQHKDTIYWGTNPLKGVDIKTFKAHSNVWGVDQNTVFTEWRARKIDRSTFKYLNPVFVKDKNGVYDYKGKVKDADPNSFECLDSRFYSEESDSINSIWVRGYGRDAKYVFYHDQMSGSASKLGSADRNSFVSLGNNYGKDQSNIYYFNRIVSDVDIEKFRVVTLPTGANYATDGKRFLQNDRPISAGEFDHDIHERIQRVKMIFNIFRENH